MSCRRLTYPAPSRDWQQDAFGLWSSLRWSKEAVLAATAGGAWFQKGRHEFADRAAAMAAGAAE